MEKEMSDILSIFPFSHFSLQHTPGREMAWENLDNIFFSFMIKMYLLHKQNQRCSKLKQHNSKSVLRK